MKYLIAAAAILLATTAHAAPKLPTIFHGQWCGENHSMQRCTLDDGGISVTADGFGADDIGCRLIRLTPQKPSRRDSEYRATFQCVLGSAKTRLYYWIGFYDEGRDVLFMNEANSTFTAVPKTDF